MKKQLLLSLLLAFAINTYAQTTYYWVGASGALWTASDSWNTVAAGGGSTRTTPAEDDILIFDGASLGGARTVTGLPRQTVGSLILKNNASITLDAPAAFEQKAFAVTGTLYGGSTVSLTDPGSLNAFAGLKAGDVISNVAGVANQLALGVVLAIKDGNTITISKDISTTTSNLIAALTSYYVLPTLHTTTFNIEAGSVLNFGGSSGGFVALNIAAKGGSIAGSINYNSRGGATKLIGTTPNNNNPALGIRFKSGSFCTFNGNSNGRNQFPLGATMGEYKNGTFIFNDGNGNNNLTPGYNGAAGIVFESGSTFTNQSAAGLLGSPFGHTVYSDNTSLVFTPGTRFEPGSNYNQSPNNNATPYFFSDIAASYPNLEFRNGLPANFTAGKVENLTIATSAAIAASTGTILVTGNINNNTANSIHLGNVILVGTNAQTITENNGTVETDQLVFGDLIVADKANVTLASNIDAANVNLLGTLNFGANTITGTGSFYAFGTFNKTAAASYTQGANTITGVDNSGVGTQNYPYPVGATVISSSYLPSGTIYRSFTSGNVGTLSAFATATGSAVANFTNTGYKFTTSAASLSASTPGFVSTVLDINGQTMPLTLLDFIAKAANGSAVLSWETIDETGVKEFAIQKIDANNQAKVIATVAARNNKAVKQNYQFTDANVAAGNNYYRLAITDFDGTVAYSEIRTVNVGGLNQVSFSIYPNPAVSILNIEHAATKGVASIIITNISGQVVYSKSVIAGSTKSQLDVSTLSSGLYFLKLDNAENSGIARFVKN